MKCLKISLILSLVYGNSLIACDVCGCALNLYNDYSLSLVKGNLIGVQYTYTSYTSHPEDARFTTHESYHAYSLMARWQWTEDIRLDMVLPYRVNAQKTARGQNLSVSGLSDATVSLMYQIFNLPWSRFSHFLLLSTGVKIPIGDYDYKNNDVRNANFQLSSGSWDVPLNVYYGVLFGDLTLMYHMQYMWTAKNKIDYKFGNRWANAIVSTYSTYFNDFDLTYTASVQYLHVLKDRIKGDDVLESGGGQLNAILGVQVYYNHFLLNISYTNPMYQYMSEGFLEQASTLNGSIAYMF